ERGVSRRHAAGVEGIDLLVLRHIDDGEYVRRDPGAAWLYEIEHRRRRHCGVDSITALAHDLQASLRGQRLASRDHAVGRHHFASPLSPPPFTPPPPHTP